MKFAIMDGETYIVRPMLLKPNDRDWRRYTVSAFIEGKRYKVFQAADGLYEIGAISDDSKTVYSLELE